MPSLKSLRGPVAALCAALALLTLPRAAHAGTQRWSTPVGLWAPIDKATGKPLGLISIFEHHGLYYGRIEPTSAHDHSAARCTRCTGSRHDQPIIGLILMRHLHYKDGHYVGGDIVDPNTGRVYDCELRLIDGGRKLVMRGYIGIPLFGLSQVWHRVEDTPGGPLRLAGGR
ncbi:MAG: DUF2147 domain-containing protein [Steroidobacteraceae bacterium]|jgi:uncharacterized protein (DUF2147 family)